MPSTTSSTTLQDNKLPSGTASHILIINIVTDIHAGQSQFNFPQDSSHKFLLQEIPGFEITMEMIPAYFIQTGIQKLEIYA